MTVILSENSVYSLALNFYIFRYCQSLLGIVFGMWFVSEALPLTYWVVSFSNVGKGKRGGEMCHLCYNMCSKQKLPKFINTAMLDVWQFKFSSVVIGKETCVLFRTFSWTEVLMKRLRVKLFLYSIAVAVEWNVKIYSLFQHLLIIFCFSTEFQLILMMNWRIVIHMKLWNLWRSILILVCQLMPTQESKPSINAVLRFHPFNYKRN